MSKDFNLDTVLTDELKHHGVKGMKWGVRKDRDRATNKLSKSEKKTYKTEMGKVLDKRFDRLFEGEAPLDYKSLSNKKVTINKGSEVYRVVAKKNRDAPDRYISTNEQDRANYKVAMPPPPLFGQAYEVTLKTTEKLTSPSEKERFDAFTTILDQPSVVMKDGKTITGREYLKKNGYGREVKDINTQRVGAATYRGMLVDQWMDTPLNDAYFKEVRSRGYNALIDDNDRGILSKSPVILLNPDYTVKRTSIKPITKDDINDAKREFKSV